LLGKKKHAIEVVNATTCKKNKQIPIKDFKKKTDEERRRGREKNGGGATLCYMKENRVPCWGAGACFKQNLGNCVPQTSQACLPCHDCQF